MNKTGGIASHSQWAPFSSLPVIPGIATLENRSSPRLYGQVMVRRRALEEWSDTDHIGFSKGGPSHSSATRGPGLAPQSTTLWTKFHSSFSGHADCTNVAMPTVTLSLTHQSYFLLPHAEFPYILRQSYLILEALYFTGEGDQDLLPICFQQLLSLKSNFHVAPLECSIPNIIERVAFFRPQNAPIKSSPQSNHCLPTRFTLIYLQDTIHKNFLRQKSSAPTYLAVYT